MGLFGNSKEIENVYANGHKVERVHANNKLIWESTIYVEKPTVSGAYTYNGSTQTAAIVGFDSTAMSISGTQAAIEAGSYNVYISLNKGYAWVDESTDSLTFTWSIGKKHISIPTLSSTWFAWVEGQAHSVFVNGIDTAFVSQAGDLSQTDTSSNIGTTHSVTWSLNNTTSCEWEDGSSNSKSASWGAYWSNGTSHYMNDIYNCGWNSGKLVSYGNTVNWGDGNTPYITVSGESSTGCVYVNDSSFTERGIHMAVRHETKTANIHLYLRKKSDVSKYLTYADSSATASVGTSYVELYGKNPANTSWVMSDFYCGISSMSTHYIQRIWHD